MIKIIVSTNPGKNYEKIGEQVADTKSQIEEKITLANYVKESWGILPLSQRVDYLAKALKLFKSNQKQIVDLIHQEIGTPAGDVDGEVSWDWEYWEWFLDNADKALSPVTTYESSSTLHQIHYEPLGTIAVITPWNLPFDMFVWGVVPTLLAGNTVIYKAAEECILSGKLYGEIINKVGLPKGVFQVVHGDGEEGSVLVNGDIDGIWFTGSTEVGQKLSELAGNKFIKATLEMGGSNPVLVFEDADLELAASKIVSKRFMFSGQTCDADKRLIVHSSVKEKLVKIILDKVGKLPITPLVSEKQLNILVGQVEDSVSKGARVLVGGKVGGLKGAYYLPTVVDNVTTNMKVWNEEVFGPVLPIMSFDTDEQALLLANDTVYGLGSQIFTNDRRRISKFARALKAGNVDVNGVGHWLPQNPFGGYKKSGMGREHGIEGLRELCQIKTISLPK